MHVDLHWLFNLTPLEYVTAWIKQFIYITFIWIIKEITASLFAIIKDAAMKINAQISLDDKHWFPKVDT